MIFQSVNAVDSRVIGNATTIRGADEETVKQRVLQLATISGGLVATSNNGGATKVIQKSKITPKNLQLSFINQSMNSGRMPEVPGTSDTPSS